MEGLIVPLYEFECEDCGAITEAIVKRDDMNPVPCDECGGLETKRVPISQTNFSLKGHGWFKDGYSSTPKEGGE